MPQNPWFVAFPTSIAENYLFGKHWHLLPWEPVGPLECKAIIAHRSPPLLGEGDREKRGPLGNGNSCRGLLTQGMAWAKATTALEESNMHPRASGMFGMGVIAKWGASGPGGRSEASTRELRHGPGRCGSGLRDADWT